MLVLTKAPKSELALEILQVERKNLIQEKCRDAIAARAKPKMANPVRFKIEDRHRVMYCDVPKVRRNRNFIIIRKQKKKK
jgi:hypothetical protein